MIRNRAALAAAACLAGVCAGSIGAAQADTGSTGTTGATGASGAAATITVNGSATAAVPSDASSATINSTYLSALSSALSDANTKATSLSEAVGDTLGAVQNITEQSDDSGLCSGPVAFARTTPAVAPKPQKKKGHPSSKTKGARARTADEIGTCTVDAEITVTYAMAPA
jgi:uncharacterized protein YggE